METILTNYGIPTSLVLGGVAILTAIILAVKVRALPTGTDLMRRVRPRLKKERRLTSAARSRRSAPLRSSC